MHGSAYNVHRRGFVASEFTTAGVTESEAKAQGTKVAMGRRAKQEAQGDVEPWRVCGWLCVPLDRRVAEV